ncbi:16S rRNA (adenine1518-N6/adenine1519-N6)-dimethyltransferase [Mycoplasma testudineum]|uniref:Ribosomal RNA small subunit methyltransferase A n=1 Tax=Mycoplasma testudineum TaxID=244584 RepID=A0A4R6ID11_9MOLU|nr:16S rRNA (adenine(1518)-N(6)/adenine(1519)-N(6))-dimethyltransferase RsmA [Mycoplasma testudineum]OYD26746.1 ribosomal RNA small subunit methyltransferase A [Mycoplasma testudineum]TDO19882.1 16S rRNA (adenine1518-N6/adenine1519-N6)-dimethyltransferase [Mycoplasma testudineum]
MAKKKWGQNFLVSQKHINKIVESANIENNNVLEIGPGKGAITKELVKSAKKVIAYEIDPDMINVLNLSIQADNFKLINQDFLEADLSQLEGLWVVVANLPYYITSDIIFKLIDNYEKFDQITIMVQKEVGQRILALPGQSEYSKLSVSLQMLYDVELITNVSAKHFNPSPKVDSMVIQLNKLELDLDFDIKDVLEFVKNIFRQRRKTLWNNVKDLMSQSLFSQFCQDLNLSENVRAQNLDVNQIYDLYMYIKGEKYE